MVDLLRMGWDYYDTFFPNLVPERKFLQPLHHLIRQPVDTWIQKSLSHFVHTPLFWRRMKHPPSPILSKPHITHKFAEFPLLVYFLGYPPTCWGIHTLWICYSTSTEMEKLLIYIYIYIYSFLLLQDNENESWQDFLTWIPWEIYHIHKFRVQTTVIRGLQKHLFHFPLAQRLGRSYGLHFDQMKIVNFFVTSTLAITLSSTDRNTRVHRWWCIIRIPITIWLRR